MKCFILDTNTKTVVTYDIKHKFPHDDSDNCAIPITQPHFWQYKILKGDNLSNLIKINCCDMLDYLKLPDARQCSVS